MKVLPVPDYAWLQEGAFLDADGNPVECYHPLQLLRDVPIENDPKAAYAIPAGAKGVALFFQAEPDGLVHCEFGWPDTSFSFGMVAKADLRRLEQDR